MTASEQREPTVPSACFWCDQPERLHFSRWGNSVGFHTYVAPPQSVIKQRMLARRAARRG